MKALFLVLGLAGLALLKPTKVEATAYDPYFRKYADNPRLAKAVAMVESGLNPNALGDQGRAYGLMQIWYDTARGHGYQGASWGLFDPEVNIYYATRELNHLVSRYGFDRGVMGYNIGETKLRKGGANLDYLNKVLSQYGKVVIT